MCRSGAASRGCCSPGAAGRVRRIHAGCRRHTSSSTRSSIWRRCCLGPHRRGNVQHTRGRALRPCLCGEFLRLEHGLAQGRSGAAASRRISPRPGAGSPGRPGRQGASGSLHMSCQCWRLLAIRRCRRRACPGAFRVVFRGRLRVVATRLPRSARLRGPAGRHSASAHGLRGGGNGCPGPASARAPAARALPPWSCPGGTAPPPPPGLGVACSSGPSSVWHAA
mmetsp:Transcript_20320/g.78043  ORF Transcript_20320/g.78043 Transcript_20320/m.78043 type:complete len:223 (+) Transcript_20320:992-1660(+)